MSSILHVTTSDGDTKLWMAEVQKERENGERFIIEQSSDDIKKAWLQKLGFLLANYTGKFVGWDYQGDPAKCVLANFPEGYKLFVIKSGGRLDHYLCGFTKQFRSPQEFHLHLLWLMKGMPIKKRNHCGCCYCYPKRSQGDISEMFPLSSGSSSSSSRASAKTILASEAIKQKRVINYNRNSLISNRAPVVHQSSNPIPHTTVGELHTSPIPDTDVIELD